MSDSTGVTGPQVPDVTWVTEPPVLEVSPEAVGVSVTRFQQSVEFYGSIPGDPEAVTKENPDGDTDLSNRMNRHKGGALLIARIIDKKADASNKNLSVFEYTLAGEPLALMQLSTRGGALEIENLASHPGTEMAGGIMVEFALNRIAHFNANSQDKQLMEDMIVLNSMNPSSTAAWIALGFVPLGKNPDLTGHLNPIPMSLDANKSPKWTKLDNKWRHVAYATKPNYLKAYKPKTI